ncbi:uncharacterized protein [Cherax quadricarinatus]
MTHRALSSLPPPRRSGERGVGEAVYPGVHLQSKGVPSIDSFVQWMKPVPTLSTITVCLHLHLFHWRSHQMPLLSYSVPEFPDELLIYVDWNMAAVIVVCCHGNGRVEKDGVFTLPMLRTWVHVCLAMDLQAGRYSLTLDSRFYSGNITQLSGREMRMQGGGILILGQKQDVYGKSINLEHTLEAHIATLLIFPEYLREKLIREFVSCDVMTFDSAIVSFSSLTTDWKASGDVRLVNFTKANICGPAPKIHTMFPEHRTFLEAQMLCSMLKGTLAVPESELENTEIVTASKSSLEKCSISQGVYLWLGIGVSHESNSEDYIYLETNATLHYTNFRQGYDRYANSSRCVFLDSLNVGQWVVNPCSVKTCAVCTFRNVTLLTLRGLCQDSVFDHIYIINGERNDKPLFDGTSHTYIYWNNVTWMMRDMMNQRVYATMETTKIMQYPLGVHKWSIIGDTCSTSHQHQLLLTACQVNQYTCDDGTCVPKEARCNLEANCPDQSDERDCKIVEIPKDYIKAAPPARRGTEPVRIKINVTILSIQPIDTVNMKLTIDLSVDLVWQDPRLSMKSINSAETRNVIQEGDKIWKPELLFQDVTGTEACITSHWQIFVAVKESEPNPDNKSMVTEDDVYPGETNSLKLTKTYTVKVSCQMKFENYPFDTQRCSFIISLPRFTQDLVAFTSSDNTVGYRGFKNLKEYEMRCVEMIESNWNNHSGREIKIRLENLSGFYVSSTYIPTFLMVLICYSTFYFDLDDFTNRIMVSLTALLVLATLFSQITQTTPKTSYLKLLDVWFVASILVNFSIVIMLVIINHQRMRESNIMVAPFSKKKAMYSTPERSRKINSFSQVAIPIVLFILITTYVGVSVQRNWR